MAFGECDSENVLITFKCAGSVSEIVTGGVGGLYRGAGRGTWERGRLRGVTIKKQNRGSRTLVSMPIVDVTVWLNKIT